MTIPLFFDPGVHLFSMWISCFEACLDLSVFTCHHWKRGTELHIMICTKPSVFFKIMMNIVFSPPQNILLAPPRLALHFAVNALVLSRGLSYVMTILMHRALESIQQCTGRRHIEWSPGLSSPANFTASRTVLIIMIG
jgi:hypothetical protein